MYYIEWSTSAVKLLLMQGDGQIANIVSREYPLHSRIRAGASKNPRLTGGCCLCRHSGLLNGFDASQVAGIGLKARCTAWWCWMHRTK